MLPVELWSSSFSSNLILSRQVSVLTRSRFVEVIVYVVQVVSMGKRSIGRIVRIVIRSKEGFVTVRTLRA